MDATTKVVTGYGTTAADTAIQAAVTATLALSRGGYIRFSGNAFPLDTYIDIPTGTSPNPLGLLGVQTWQRDEGTAFNATTSFPTNRYFFETSGATDGSLKHAVLFMENLGGYNLNFATLNAGFLKFDSDSNHPRILQLDNIYMQYMWRGIHLLGAIWWPIIRNIHFEDFNASFVGDADIKLEQGSHTSATINPWPKNCSFKDILSVHTGAMNNSLNAIDCAYSTFDNYNVDGESSSYYFVDSVWAFTGKAQHNEMRNPIALDLNTTPAPDNRTGCLLFSGTNCFNNRVLGGKLTKYKYMVALKSGTYRNEIETAGYWGNTLEIDDAGSGVDNTIIIYPGSLASGTPFAQPILTGTATNLNIIDRRNGMYNRGPAYPPIRRTGYYTGAGLGTTNACAGLLDGQGATIAVAAGGSSGIATTGGLKWVWSSGATINGLGGLRFNGNKFMERSLNPMIQAKLQLRNGITTERAFFGFVSSTTAPASSADPLANLSGVGFFYDSAVDTEWLIMQNDGSASSDSTTIINVATVDQLAHTFAIKAVAASNKFQYSYDGGTWTNVSTKIPGANTALGYLWYVECTAASARTIDCYWSWVEEDG